MADLDNPLPPETAQDIRDRLKDLDKADKLIAKAVAAGMDVSGIQAETRKLREQLVRLKSSFFPGR